jgi:hypothetical protein
MAALMLLGGCRDVVVNVHPGEVPLDDDVKAPPADWTPKVAEARAGPPVLYLDFEGARLDHADSFIVPKGQAVDFPPFDPRPYGVRDRAGAIEQVTARVAEHYAETGLVVVHERPAHGPYTTVVVGGLPSLVDEDPGVAGVSPLDPGDRSPADIAFAFAGVLGHGRGDADLEQLASVIAHEAGHSYGLEHDIEPASLMYPAVEDEMIGFMAAETLDGIWQDAPAILRKVLGPVTPGTASGSDSGRESPATGPGSERQPPTPERCGDDPLEPDDTRDAARPLPGPDDAVRVCAGDEDWFRFDLQAAESVDLALAHPAGASPSPPQVFRPRGRTPLGDTYTQAGAVGVRFVAPVAGTYRVRVASDGPAVEYHVRLTRR